MSHRNHFAPGVLMSCPRRAALALASSMVLLGLPSTAHAQCRIDLVESGIEAYRDLELSDAAARFEEAVTDNTSAQCATANARALVYLGATHWLAERPDSAIEAFRRAVVQAPRFRPDPVEFPPSVTDLFSRVQGRTPAVAPTLPEEVRISPGSPDERLTVGLIASIEHPVSVTVRSSGTSVRTLHDGIIAADADGTVVEWDGRDHDGRAVETGWYDLEIVSKDSLSRPVRMVVVALGVEAEASPEPEMVEVVDTIGPAPGEVDEGSAWKATAIGAAGLLGAGAIVAIPFAADGGSGSWARYPAAGAVGLAGIYGFFRALAGDDPPPVRTETRLVPATHSPPPVPTLRIRPAYTRRVELEPVRADAARRLDGRGVSR